MSDFGSSTRVDFHLENWRLWMRHPELRLECPPKSLGFVAGGNYTSLEDWEAECDAMAAKAVDTLITDLTPVERCALHHRYLHAVFRFSGKPYIEALGSARDAIGRGLRRWGIL